MKTFKQIVENIVVLDEAVMDQKMWDQTKKGDKLTISYDSGIKKGNKTTFVVGTKNIVGKAKVGKITMKREDGKGGKFFLYNRNGNISLALGDMAASMTGLVKESVEVELEERNYAKEYANYHSKPEQIANRSSRNKARRIMAKENDVDGMDVGHADNDPLNNDPANLRIENPSDNRREPRMRNEGKNDKYPLYHKDFSGAMKTAYDHAKKNLGVIVDPSEIDDKVAMGPKKPSTGKTNSYRLTDKSGKKAIQVQVYNTGKSYELNMYKEDLDEAISNNMRLINKIKKSGVVKSGSMSKDPAPKKEEKAELDENMSRVAKELEAYARKNGGIDKMDFMKAAMMMKKGQTVQLKKFVDDLDTEPREKILSLMGEGTELDESFKAGGLKLKDGKQVMVKKDDAMMLNDLMKQLSKPNVKKMTDTAMQNKKGYEEILGFARDSHE